MVMADYVWPLRVADNSAQPAAIATPCRAGMVDDKRLDASYRQPNRKRNRPPKRPDELMCGEKSRLREERH
jgi:hypothetical protein